MKNKLGEMYSSEGIHVCSPVFQYNILDRNSFMCPKVCVTQQLCREVVMDMTRLVLVTSYSATRCRTLNEDLHLESSSSSDISLNPHLSLFSLIDVNFGLS